MSGPSKLSSGSARSWHFLEAPATPLRAIARGDSKDRIWSRGIHYREPASEASWNRPSIMLGRCCRDLRELDQVRILQRAGRHRSAFRRGFRIGFPPRRCARHQPNSGPSRKRMRRMPTRVRFRSLEEKGRFRRKDHDFRKIAVMIPKARPAILPASAFTAKILERLNRRLRALLLADEDPALSNRFESKAVQMPSSPRPNRRLSRTIPLGSRRPVRQRPEMFQPSP
jgi:hypothetical protein